MIEIFEKQEEFQRLVGFPVDSIKETDRNDMSEKFVFKAIEELIELRKEFPSSMNPWSKNQKLADYNRVKEEFSDVLLFLVNFANVWKISPVDILRSLREIQNKNFDKLKEKKMRNLNQEIKSIPGMISTVGHGYLDAETIIINESATSGYVDERGRNYYTYRIKDTTGKATPEQLEFWNDILQREIDIIKINNPHVKIEEITTTSSN